MVPFSAGNASHVNAGDLVEEKMRRKHSSYEKKLRAGDRFEVKMHRRPTSSSRTSRPGSVTYISPGELDDQKKGDASGEQKNTKYPQKKSGAATAQEKFDERLRSKLLQSYQENKSLHSSMPPRLLNQVQADAKCSVLEDKIKLKLQRQDEDTTTAERPRRAYSRQTLPISKSMGSASLQESSASLRASMLYDPSTGRRISRRKLLDDKLERHRSSLRSNGSSRRNLKDLERRSSSSLTASIRSVASQSDVSAQDVHKEPLGHEETKQDNEPSPTATFTTWNELDDVMQIAKMISLSEIAFDPSTIDFDP